VRSPAPPTFALAVDRSSIVPLHRQVCAALRDAILSGRLRAGARLPSTRTLADDLGLSRTTVFNAFDQLLAEGYLQGRQGSGTYVAEELVAELLRGMAEVPSGPEKSSAAPALSRRGAQLVALGTALSDNRPQAFRPGIPALDHVPRQPWARLAGRHLRGSTDELLNYGEPGGHRPLREAIASYLGAARGVRCEPEQVVIVSGAQQGLSLLARLLLDPGDRVWIEEPGYLGARGALAAAGVRLVPVPVDAEGLDVAAGMRRSPRARLAYVSPSHQYPLGVTMSAARRLRLLDWARRENAFVVEDDYDCEFRYAGGPLASLQGLDRQDRVLYLGTFSKVLFPSLRLGYLVVPEGLVEKVERARSLEDSSPLLEQAVLADFIAGGHFARHVRRMRALYRERQGVLVEEAKRRLAGLLDVRPSEAGTHVVGWLPDELSDVVASRRAESMGLAAPALSSYCQEQPPRSGLVLGYSHLSPREIRTGVRRLAQALEGA
jgi:GntR family transcriptional regulator / MocR family aminotransferase